jgi:hypothetical protein
VASLLDLLENTPGLHWRYVLIASGAIYVLLRKDVEPPEGVYAWFSKNLTSDIAPMRLLSYGLPF